VTTPGWTRKLLDRLAPAGRADDLVGDLEEAHRERLLRRGRRMATVLTMLEAIDMAWALLRGRFRGNAAARSAQRRGLPAGGSGSDPMPGIGGPDRSRVRISSVGGGSGFSWLDFKLGFRMLLKYPGLTLVGGLAMAFSIWAGASFFELIRQAIDPDLGFPNSERIVGVQLWDSEANRPENQAMQDFLVWREEVRSIEELGAFHGAEMNLVTPAGDGAPELVAEMTASGFRITGVKPLLGRVLIEADELATADPVVVLGYRVWQARFASDPTVVGKTIHLGGVARTIVGVMPERFHFPVSHDLWTPLRTNGIQGGISGRDATVLGRLVLGPRNGPRIQMFGRLADGFSMDQAQAELTQLGERAAAASPEAGAHIRPQVMRYSRSIIAFPDLAMLGIASSNLLLVLLLLVVCGNVALLMFARAAARENEIVVRSALGAGRRRIITQLFTEALVLGGLSAVIGLACAGYGLRWALTVVEGQVAQFGARMPFWFVDRLSPLTIVYACALTLLAAVVAGVGPALRITGHDVAGRLRKTGGGGKQIGFGGVWSVVIVLQVALTVAFPATAFFVRKDMKRVSDFSFGYPANEYAIARLEIDEKVPADGSEEPRDERLARYRTALAELQRRLTDAPGVAAVAFSDQLPLKYHPWLQIEVDEGAIAAPDERGHRIAAETVDVDYFDVFDADVLQGRDFDAADVGSGSPVVIVNEWFVEDVLGGKNPIGRRIRYVDADGRLPAVAQTTLAENGVTQSQWFEVVGVVRDLGVTNGYGKKGVYHPVAPGESFPTYLIAHVGANPMDFMPTLRQVTSAVDPTLRLHAMMPLTEVPTTEVQFYSFWLKLAVMVSGVALLLALAGIYAVTAFTVSQRTREIGIRVALGSDGRHVAVAIFRRPLIQVMLGVLVGSVWATFLDWGMMRGITWKAGLALVGYALFMLSVCLIACIVPTRRALSVQPTDALRSDG
jgi:putative ABC transport system permease protein